jgi:hypothetical protein
MKPNALTPDLPRYSNKLSSGDKITLMENEPKNNVESLLERAGDYLETRLDLWKLKATQKSSDIISSIASGFILAIIAAIFFMILNIGIALFLGELMGKSYYGFFVLAAFYLIAGLIFKSAKNKWVKDPVTNAIIKKIYN